MWALVDERRPKDGVAFSVIRRPLRSRNSVGLALESSNTCREQKRSQKQDRCSDVEFDDKSDFPTPHVLAPTRHAQDEKQDSAIGKVSRPEIAPLFARTYIMNTVLFPHPQSFSFLPTILRPPLLPNAQHG